MHKRILSVALITVFVLLLSATAVFAYTGVTGVVIDSKNSDPWEYGGDVYVLDDAGNIVSTCELSQASGTEGEFDCTYGTDAIGGSYSFAGGSPTPNTDVTVYIDFECNESNNCSGGPNGTPSTMSFQYTEANLPFKYNAGYQETGTGPTAVTISDVQVGTSTARAGLPVAAAAGIAALAAGALTLLRRRRNS